MGWLRLVRIRIVYWWHVQMTIIHQDEILSADMYNIYVNPAMNRIQHSNIDATIGNLRTNISGCADELRPKKVPVFPLTCRKQLGSLGRLPSFRTHVISYPGHFVPAFVISYLLSGHFIPSNNHFVPILVISYLRCFVPFFVISYPFWSICTQQKWMDWLMMNGRTDRRVLIEMTN